MEMNLKYCYFNLCLKCPDKFQIHIFRSEIVNFINLGVIRCNKFLNMK